MDRGSLDVVVGTALQAGRSASQQGMINVRALSTYPVYRFATRFFLDCPADLVSDEAGGAAGLEETPFWRRTSRWQRPRALSSSRAASSMPPSTAAGHRAARRPLETLIGVIVGCDAAAVTRAKPTTVP